MRRRSTRQGLGEEAERPRLPALTFNRGEKKGWRLVGREEQMMRSSSVVTTKGCKHKSERYLNGGVLHEDAENCGVCALYKVPGAV